ncbi:MAG: ACP S-malonyltransferase [Candidatus Omnitrophota bacterium]
MVAYLFAGQGAQYVGMGKDLYNTFPESKAVFDKAQDVLGWNLKAQCFDGPEDMLKMTHISQPAVLTMSIAAFEAFKAVVGLRIEEAGFTAGLSLGEYSALVASGVLKFEDAVRVVRKRADLMNNAALKNPGKMAAIIGLDTAVIKEACINIGKVEVANFNCPGQVVISGEKAAVDKAKTLALEKGAKKTVDLDVSGAFHSSLMREAAREYGDFIKDHLVLTEAKIPVVSNVDAAAKSKATEFSESLVKQIYSSVLWEGSMRFMLSQGITKYYEFGPGKVLKGLMRRIDPKAEVINIEKKEDILNLNKEEVNNAS